MSLNLKSLESAVQTLNSSVSILENFEFMNGINIVQKNTIHAGIIQHFEFTYELCWKFIQRWIKANKTPEDAETRTKKDLFRMADKYKLIKQPQNWFLYSEARNLTTHTYDQAVADEVLKSAIEFLPDSKFLLKKLKEYND